MFDNGAPATVVNLQSIDEYKIQKSQNKNHAPNGIYSLLRITTVYSIRLKVPSGFFYLLQVKIFCGSDAHFKIVFNFFTEPASELWIVIMIVCLSFQAC